MSLFVTDVLTLCVFVSLYFVFVYYVPFCGQTHRIGLNSRIQIIMGSSERLMQTQYCAWTFLFSCHAFGVSYWRWVLSDYLCECWKKPGCTLYKSLLLWLHCVHHIRLVTTYSPRELSGSGRIVKIAIRYIPSTRYESGSGLPGISQFHSPKFLDEYILGLQYSIWCNVELPQLR